MKHRPSEVLLRTLNPDERDSLVAQFSHADLFRLRAIQLLIDRYRTTMKSQRAMDYSQPAWSAMQADHNARLRTLEEVLKDIFNHEVFSTGDTT